MIHRKPLIIIHIPLVGESFLVSVKAIYLIFLLDLSTSSGKL